MVIETSWKVLRHSIVSGTEIVVKMVIRWLLKDKTNKHE